MSDDSGSNYFSWEVATTGKLSALAFDGENVVTQDSDEEEESSPVKEDNACPPKPCKFSTIIDQDTFYSAPLGKGSLGGVNQVVFSQGIETGRPAITFAADDNMSVHGDLEVKGDLNVDGGLVVHGEITTDFLHTKQTEEAPEEPDEDEVFLTQHELEAIEMAMGDMDVTDLADRMGIPQATAVVVMNEIYKKLFDD